MLLTCNPCLPFNPGKPTDPGLPWEKKNRITEVSIRNTTCEMLGHELSTQRSPLDYRVYTIQKKTTITLFHGLERNETQYFKQWCCTANGLSPMYIVQCERRLSKTCCQWVTTIRAKVILRVKWNVVFQSESNCDHCLFFDRSTTTG